MKQIQPVDVAMASPAVASPVKDDFESNLDLELEKLDSGPLDQEESESQSGISSRGKSPTGNGVSGSTNQDQHEDSPLNGNVSDNNGVLDEESSDIQEGPKSNEGEEKTTNTDEGEDNNGEEMDEDDDDEEDDVDDEDDEDQDVDSLLKEVSELVDSDSDSKDETRNTQARPPPNLEEDEEDEAAMLLLEDSQSPQPAPMDMDEATTSRLLEDDDDMTSDFVAAEADLGETLDLNSDITSKVENFEVSNNSITINCKTDEGKTEKSEELSIQDEKSCITVETESKSVSEVKQKEATPAAAALEEDSGVADSQSSTDPTSMDSHPSTRIEESSKVTTSEQGTNDITDSDLRNRAPNLTIATETKLAEDCVETPSAEMLDRSPKSKSENGAKGGYNESKQLEEKDVIDHVIDDNKQEPTSVNEDAKPDILSSVNEKITNTDATKNSEPMDVSAVDNEAELTSKDKASNSSKEEKKDESNVSPSTNELKTKDDEDGTTNGTAFLDEALDALHGIAQSNRKLLDDESPTKRPRALDTDSEEPIVPAKKVKISDSEEAAKLQNDDEEVPAKAVKKLKKVVKRMSRTEIEDLVTEIMVEVLSGRSEIGKLRQKCDSYDENLELWKRKATALQKQCQDLNTVMRKYITDVKNRPQDKFTPIKITRSVGLQVVGDRKRLSVNGAPTSVIKMTPLQQMGATKKATQSSNVSIPREANNPNSPIVVPGVSNPKVPMRYPLPQNTGGSNILTLRKVPVIGSSNPGPKSKATTTASSNAPKSLLQPVGTKVTVPNSMAPTTGSQNNVPQKPPPTKATKAPNDVIDIVDLSDEDEKTTPSSTVNKPIGLVPINRLQKPQASRQNGPPMNVNRSLSNQPPSLFSFSGHPAPLPTLPLSQYKMKNQPGFKATPPKPSLKISKLKSGIVLSWNMDLMPTLHAEITFYQIFAYQEGNAAPSPSLWKKVGDVRALPLPMACTLTQFQKGHKYHFAVRALDTHQRLGNFSDPQSIQLS